MTGRVLITGVSGFIGKHLARFLFENNYEVYGVDKNIIEIENVVSLKGDIFDIERMREICKGIDFVIHLAGITYLPEASKDLFRTFDINTLGTFCMLKSFVESNASKFVFASTAKVYGIPEYLPIDENHSTNPKTIYGNSKMIAENFINAFAPEFDKQFIILRQFNIFGPGQSENFLIPSILNQMGKGNIIELGDISIKRDFLFIDDLLRAYKLALEKDFKCEIFNIGSGKSHSVESVIKMASEIFKKDIEIKTDKRKFRIEHKDEYADISKAREYLNWSPKIEIKKGLKMIIHQVN